MSNPPFKLFDSIAIGSSLLIVFSDPNSQVSTAVMETCQSQVGNSVSVTTISLLGFVDICRNNAQQTSNNGCAIVVLENDASMALITLDVISYLMKSVLPGSPVICLELARLSDANLFSNMVLCGLQNVKKEIASVAENDVSVVMALSPNWEIGVSAKVKLNVNSNVQSVGSTNKSQASIADDDLINEDDLLQDGDFSAEAKAKARGSGDVLKPKSACKNCTCGRAEGRIVETSNEPSDCGPSGSISLPVASNVSQPKSACGSCYLGDAFRCSTCPFLGKPAFEPGDLLKLKVNDDVAAAPVSQSISTSSFVGGKVMLSLDDSDLFN